MEDRTCKFCIATNSNIFLINFPSYPCCSIRTYFILIIDLLLGCLNILLLSIIQITTSISKLNKKIQFHLESSKAQILDNFKKGNKIWDSKLHSSNSYHTNSRVKSIWPVEMLGFQRSLANFRKIVIYNFGPTTGTETTFREITFLRYRENFDPVLSQTFRLFCRRDPWDTRKKRRGTGKNKEKSRRKMLCEKLLAFLACFRSTIHAPSFT